MGTSGSFGWTLFVNWEEMSVSPDSFTKPRGLLDTEAHTRQPSIEGLKLSECLHCEAMLGHAVFRSGKTLHPPQTKIRVLGYRWFTGEVLALQV